MPWYLYLALKQLFATFQRIFFTAISVVSVAMGVTILLVVLSVMGGFGEKIGEMTVETQGDIQLSADGTIDNPAQLQAELAKIPGVVATTPFAHGFLFVMRDLLPAPANGQGIDLDTVEKVTPLNKYIIVGSLNDLDDDSVILSSKLADSIRATVGSKVQVGSPRNVKELVGDSDERTIPRELTVAGIFQIGHEQLDKSTVIVTLREMQDLYALGSSVHGINLKIERNLDPDKEATLINHTLARLQQTGVLPTYQNLWAVSWKRQNQDFLWAVQLEKSIMTFILLIVVLVAAFLTMSLLLVLVLKKTREIGLLGALGATRPQVAACFCLQGVGIGILGTALGLVLGFTLLHFRNGIIGFLLHFTGGSEDSLQNVYQFSQIPSHSIPSDVAIISVSAIILSTLAGLVPALIAARMNPVEALRNE